MKSEIGSSSPFTYTSAGDEAVPRLTVWLIWLESLQLLVTVTWFAVPVETIRRPSGLLEEPLAYWHAWVLLRVWTAGFEFRFVRKDWIAVGLSEASGAIVFRLVVAVVVACWSCACRSAC